MPITSCFSSLLLALQSVDTEAECNSELGVVISSSSSSSSSSTTTNATSRELQVTWQQPMRFFVRMHPAEEGKKIDEYGGNFVNPLECLQKEGVLRFLIRGGDDGWPAFTAQFPLSSLTCSALQHSTEDCCCCYCCCVGVGPGAVHHGHTLAGAHAAYTASSSHPLACLAAFITLRTLADF